MNERRVYITGAGNGLGNELFNTFKSNNITVNCHTHEPNNDLNKISSFGDIRNEKTQSSILKHFIETKSNVLINNVGVYSNKPFIDFTEDEIINIINVNLTSTILLTHKIFNYIIKNGGGMIYNINSVAGIKGSPYESIYCASKFGLKGFTESLLLEHRNNEDIRIVNVTLGAFKSKITKDRSNYNELAETNEVAKRIYSHVMENYKTINTELTIYRK